MATKVSAKKKTPTTKAKAIAPEKPVKKERPAPVTAMTEKDEDSVAARVVAALTQKETPKEKEERQRRREVLQRMLLGKRQEIMREIEGNLGQSLTEDQQRRLESARDVGDQALMDLDRELGISLMEMRNRKRQAIDEALTRLSEGTYGICAECGIEVSEKRLEAVPFAKLCVQCQSQQELLEKIEKEEDRD
ncbi:MAG TPA: TraR/DksA family transcriptional regulator [Nitrospira sp.]|jgi:DnaK suppressor protein|nr:TraR/DksA family transcriptional regulator [Nitrospira sp.]HNA26811.1 TraR/DksA family transcriptional regulator [Nitrospira sp.]HNI67150.1 TraR/DksA family transcriptional regulator [Nitrospira sp.]HNK14587.1 TraR/DksA family transcriptional regulator [Nitrospira sp.]HNL88145.1 TraR/DksA family transcriptional regulator [Nitrospira sp.]